MNWPDRQSLTVDQLADYGPKAPIAQIRGTRAPLTRKQRKLSTLTLATSAGSTLVALVMIASGVPKALGQKSAIDPVALNYSATAGRTIGCVEA